MKKVNKDQKRIKLIEETSRKDQMFMKKEEGSIGSSEEDEDFYLNFEECDEEAFNEWVDSL